MRQLKSMVTAFSMYSKLPMPQFSWTPEVMAWALCYLPLGGAVIGALLYAWLYVCLSFSAPVLFCGGTALAIPMLITGGLHLDGLCDTSDALASNLPRERRLEILKDTHTGAFAIINCCLYLILFFAAWCSVRLESSAILVLSLSPLLSRSLTGLASMILPNARDSGILAAFTENADIAKARVVMALWTLLSLGLMILANPVLGGVATAAALIVSVYFYTMSRRLFGGMTGDLAGFYIQLIEFAVVFAIALFQWIIGS